MIAQWKAQQSAKRPRKAKLANNEKLRGYVQELLAGHVRRPDGTIVTGPATPSWKGLNKPRRQDRRWASAWSPEQISNRLKVEFPDDGSMRISHEAIYQALYIEGRGALKRELVACLRTGRALREPRARSRNKPQGHVSPDVVFSERPAEAADRAVPGHWEGDLIIGTHRSAIGTIVERASRSTILVHLPRLEGWGETPPVKNGPSLGGYGAVAMNKALTASMTQLPAQLRKTLTWDRGKELSGHAQFGLDTGTRVFFADPHSPWQRPTNENTNGLLRQYFPKGTDLSRWSAEDLEAVALALNNRPRKTLGWKTPAEGQLTVSEALPPEAVARLAGKSYDNAMAEAFNSLYKWGRSIRKGPGRASTTWSSPPWATSIGSTTGGCMARSPGTTATQLPRSSRPCTTIKPKPSKRRSPNNPSSHESRGGSY